MHKNIIYHLIKCKKYLYYDIKRTSTDLTVAITAKYWYKTLGGAVSASMSHIFNFLKIYSVFFWHFKTVFESLMPREKLDAPSVLECLFNAANGSKIIGHC